MPLRKSTTELLKNSYIPKAAPETPVEAYRRLLDLVGAVGGLRIAAQSDTHPLHLAGGLPEEAVRKIVEAHQALMAAHRIVEGALTK